MVWLEVASTLVNCFVCFASMSWLDISYNYLLPIKLVNLLILT